MHSQRHPDPSGPAALVRASSPYYALWDLESGNSLGTYESAPEVLSLIRELIDANGSAYADALDLSTEDAAGNTTHVATGRALLDLLHPSDRRRAG